MKKIILLSSVIFTMPIVNFLGSFSFLKVENYNKSNKIDWSKFVNDALEMKVGRKIDDEISEDYNLEINTISLVYNFNQEKRFNYQNHIFSEAWQNGQEREVQWTFKLPNNVSFDRFKILSFNSFSRLQNKNFGNSYTKTSWGNSAYYGKSIADAVQNKNILDLSNQLEVLLQVTDSDWMKQGFISRQWVLFYTFVYENSSYFQIKLSHYTLRQGYVNGAIWFSLGSDISLYVDDFPVD